MVNLFVLYSFSKKRNVLELLTRFDEIILSAHCLIWKRNSSITTGRIYALERTQELLEVGNEFLHDWEKPYGNKFPNERSLEHLLGVSMRRGYYIVTFDCSAFKEDPVIQQ